MSNTTGFEVAIIGMAGKFPGSKNINELWKNLCIGKELISHFTDDELRSAGVPEEFISDPNYIKSRGIIEDVDKFDADFFGFYPKELEMLDPQHRLFLESCWNAMEDAGYIPDDYNKLVGIFGGVGMNTYVLQYLTSNKDLAVSAEGYQLSIGNDKDFLTTRVSYKLNMKGPSLDVQTACSTSLVAVHLACMNLLNYQCDLALAGGSTITFPQINGYHYQEGMILSPDGHCRPFDKDAKGTVASNGVGVVVLKRLEDALNDKDNIYAVIKGSAYNNDGATKVGYTAPGVNGQKNVISSAVSMAEVPFETINYVETHGTGTSLGDPIEIEALTKAFRNETTNNGFCAIGSVKSNLGHLDTAAGVAGLIKTALSLYHKKIVPSINFSESNPKIDFDKTPFYVSKKLAEWNKNKNPRRACVSSFGIGGTNAHVVLEEAPQKKYENLKDVYLIIPFSAKSSISINSFEDNLLDYLSKNQNKSLVNFAYTLQTGRKEFNFRKYSIAKSINELQENLSNKNSKEFFNNGEIIENPNVVFMFSGQGSQYINMGKDLYNSELIFKGYADKCFNLLKNKSNVDLKQIIYDENNNSNSASEKLKQTVYTQPALFIIEYSLAMTIIDLGVKPNMMVGHSIGEYVAACISGVIDLESALTLVYHRGLLMQSLEKGSMLSVTLSENELKKFLPNELDLAVINTPNLCVVSGQNEEINKFGKLLNEKDIGNAFLHTSHAFHSRMMEPILNEFKKVTESVEFKVPTIPYMSNVTGEKIKSLEATDPNYYVNHLRYTVRFVDNIRNLLKYKNNIFIEVGPSSTLASLTKLFEGVEGGNVLHTMRHPKQTVEDNVELYKCIGQLWLRGIKINWERFYSDKPQKLHLPTYAFNRKKYWITNDTKLNSRLGKNKNLKYFEQSWVRKPFSNLRQNANNGNDWLIINDQKNSINELLKTKNKDVKLTNVVFDKFYNKKNDFSFIVDPSSLENFYSLTKELKEQNNNQINIIYFAKDFTDQNIDVSNLENLQFDSLRGLLNFVKSIHKISNKLNLNIITENCFKITGSETISLANSAFCGIAKVIEHENPNVNSRIIDIDKFEENDEILYNVCSSKIQESVLAVRSKYLWTINFEALEVNSNESSKYLKDNGTYIITGGLGRIGLTFAEFLVKNYNAKLFLLDQYDFPQNEEWDNYLLKLDFESNEFAKLNTVNELVKSGAEIEIIKTDISDYNELKNCFDGINYSTNSIDGIFHTAGLVGESAIQIIDQFEISNFLHQLKIKFGGLRNIQLLAENVKPKFVLVQSSLSSVLGGFGFAGYSSVNNIVDSFILNLSSNQSETKWITINWDAWSFSENKNKVIPESINPMEGNQALKYILSQNFSNQIYVSKTDINERFMSSFLLEDLEENVKEENLNIHVRPNLETKYVEPENDIQKEILKEWQELLGIKEIGIEDNFFELGGNSLIGTQLVSKMRKNFEVEIPLAEVFENATVKGIDNLIKKYKRTEDKSELDDVLKSVKEMTEDEVTALLKNKSEAGN